MRSLSFHGRGGTLAQDRAIDGSEDFAQGEAEFESVVVFLKCDLASLACTHVVPEDAAVSARFASVREPEVMFAPIAEARVISGLRVGSTDRLHRHVEAGERRVGAPCAAREGAHGRDVGSAAEPAAPRLDVADIEVRRRQVRAAGVGDDRDARGGEGAARLRAGDLPRKALGEDAVDIGVIDRRFL